MKTLFVIPLKFWPQNLVQVAQHIISSWCIETPQMSTPVTSKLSSNYATSKSLDLNHPTARIWDNSVKHAPPTRVASHEHTLKNCLKTRSLIVFSPKAFFSEVPRKRNSCWCEWRFVVVRGSTTVCVRKWHFFTIKRPQHVRNGGIPESERQCFSPNDLINLLSAVLLLSHRHTQRWEGLVRWQSRELVFRHAEEIRF